MKSHGKCAAGKKQTRHQRGHWGIESSLHWGRDVISIEDIIRLITGSASKLTTRVWWLDS